MARRWATLVAETTKKAETETKKNAVWWAGLWQAAERRQRAEAKHAQPALATNDNPDPITHPEDEGFLGTLKAEAARGVRTAKTTGLPDRRTKGGRLYAMIDEQEQQRKNSN